MGLRSQLAATSGGAPAPVPAAPVPAAAPVVSTASAGAGSGGYSTAPVVPVPQAYVTAPPPASASMGGSVYPGAMPVPSAPPMYPSMPAPSAPPLYPVMGGGGMGGPGVAAPVPSAPMAVAGMGKYYPNIVHVLRSNIAENHLEAFYPPSRVEAVAAQCARVDWDTFARERGLTVEVALDYCALALYNLTYLIDDSGSMAWDAYGKPTLDINQQRWGDAIAFLQESVKIGVKFDDDGVDVCFLNSPKVLAGAKTAAEVESFMRFEVGPSGRTPLISALKEKVLDPYMAIADRSRGDLTRIKPLLVFIGTDGAPDEGVDVGFVNLKKMIQSHQQTLVRMGVPAHGIKYSAVQFGRDAGGAGMLNYLDNDPDMGDLVDTTSDFEVEAEQFLKRNPGSKPISVWEYFAKAMLGSVWKKYDSLD
jgi:hypothetical protein